MGPKTQDGKTKILVNKSSILDFPNKEIDERIVECEYSLPTGRMIYVHKAILDKKNRAVKVLDFALLEEPKNEVEISKEEMALISSLDSTPSDFMEFIFDDNEDAEDDDEEELSDSEEQEGD